MAHYAFLDENNKVIEVIPGVEETELIEGLTTEQWYGAFRGKRCIRTSYNTKGGVHLNGKTPFRGNYAGIGFTYDEVFDAFIPPQPFLSWKLNYSTFIWEAPIPMPEEKEGFVWKWSEPNKEWVQIEIPSNT